MKPMFLKTNHEQVDINTLKPGDKVMVAYTTMVGWRAFRYHTYREYTVERITPKKTKVYLTDGVSALDVNPSNTILYKVTDDVLAETKIADCASTCSNLIFKIDSAKENLHKLPDDEILKLHEHLNAALSILNNHKQA